MATASRARRRSAGRDWIIECETEEELIARVQGRDPITRPSAAQGGDMPGGLRILYLDLGEANSMASSRRFSRAPRRVGLDPGSANSCAVASRISPPARCSSAASPDRAGQFQGLASPKRRTVAAARVVGYTAAT